MLINISLKKNVSLSFVGRFLCQAQAAFFGLALASLLTKQDFGILQQLFSFSLIGVTIVRFGIDVVAQIEITKKDNVRSLEDLSINLIKIKILFSLIPLTLALIILNFLSISNLSNEIVILIGSITFFISVNKFIIDGILLYSFRISRSLVISNLIAFSKLLAITFLILTDNRNIKLILQIILLIEIVAFLYLNIYYKIFNKSFFKINFKFASKENIKHAYHQYGDVLVSTMISMAGGVLVLSFFKDFEFLASYTFILAIVIGIFSGCSLNAVLEPIFNTLLLRRLKEFANDFAKAEINELLGDWCALSLIVNLFIALCLYIFLTPLNEYFLDNKYTTELPIIFILYLGLSTLCWTYQYSTWALLRKRLDVLRNCSLISGISHYVLIMSLTHLYGLYGALYSLVLSHVIKCLLIHFYLGKPKFIKISLKIIFTEKWNVLLLLIMIIISIIILETQYNYIVFAFTISLSSLSIFNVFQNFNNLYFKKFKSL